MMEVFDNDSIRRILRVRGRDSVPSVKLWRRLRLTCIPTLLVQRKLHWLGHAVKRPDGELLLLTLPRTWRRRTEGQLKYPPEAWPTQLVTPVQPAPVECRHEYN